MYFLTSFVYLGNPSFTLVPHLKGYSISLMPTQLDLVYLFTLPSSSQQTIIRYQKAFGIHSSYFLNSFRSTGECLRQPTTRDGSSCPPPYPFQLAYNTVHVTRTLKNIIKQFSCVQIVYKQTKDIYSKTVVEWVGSLPTWYIRQYHLSLL